VPNAISGKSCWIIALILLSLALSIFISRVEVKCNDDTYVYFNYARNLVAGNGFSYDSRQIPSEGFTSLLFLLLLIPFEQFGVNLMFAAIGINLIAWVVIIIAGTLLFRKGGLITRIEVPFFVTAFGLVMAADPNITLVAGRGLETLLSPAFILLMVYCTVRFLPTRDSPNTRSRTPWFHGAWISAFLAILVRPENLFPAFFCTLVAIVHAPPPRRRWLQMLIFPVLAGLLFLTWKWFTFKSLVPTGFYRKMAAPLSLWGAKYVLKALRFYSPIITGVMVGLFGRIINDRSRSRIFPILAGIIAINLLLVCRVHPIVGYGYRFLVNAYVLLHLLFAFLASRLFTISTRRWVSRRFRVFFHCLFPVLVGVITGCSWIIWNQKTDRRFTTRLNLLQRANEATEKHPYLRFGRFMKNNLPEPEKVTFVFGDAGCIPYASHFRFIDANGLTEPYIAKLFLEKDSLKKAKLFSEYVLKWNPDIIVLKCGKPRDTGYPLRGNPHSPFLNNPRIEVYEAFRERGFLYLCSLPCYYDLHFGVRRESPHFKEVAPLLVKYCQQNSGYLLNDGLTITQGERSVTFPGLIKKKKPENSSDQSNPKTETA
jgi:hypothetical protein